MLAHVLFLQYINSIYEYTHYIQSDQVRLSHCVAESLCLCVSTSDVSRLFIIMWCIIVIIIIITGGKCVFEADGVCEL